MKPRTMLVAAIGGAGLFGALIAFAADTAQEGVDAENARYAQTMLEEGKKTFRYDTFGSEAFWGMRFNCTRPSPARRTVA